MIRSMTGFGRGTYQIDGREYTVEIKSVNNRYNDISIRIPRSMSYLEESIKKTILGKTSRGKIDVFVGVLDYGDKGKDIKINTALAKTYIEELKKLAEEADIEGKISVIDISKFPDVLILKNEDDEEEIKKEVLTTVNGALNNLILMKETEGEKLKLDSNRRLKAISDMIGKINQYSAGLVEEYIVKLETRIKQLLNTDIIDQTRLAQEVVFYSDKCSIEEELTRIKSHISQFANLLESAEPVGKKLDFIIQEMNREINTIGSKANNLEITKLVVDVKTEIENIREQIQNVE